MAAAPPPQPKASGLMGRPPAAKPSKGLFGKPAAADPVQTGPEVSGLSETVNRVNRRLRMIEDRYTNVRKKLQLIERNMLDHQKKMITETRIMDREINDIKHSILQMQNRIITVIKELKLGAKKEDVEVLNKYISMWEPVNFVTSEQVERIVREILAERHH